MALNATGAAMPPLVSRTLVSIVLALAAPPAFAESYDIDSDHTEVRFTWDHLGISRQGGRFGAVTGKVDFDPDKPEASTVEVTIPVKSISTGVKALDDILAGGKDYFDAAGHPVITFKTTGVRAKSDKTADVTGDLSINGVTRPVVLDVLWTFTGPHPLRAINPVYAGKISLGFSATTQIRRGDWGITRGAPFVSDEIRISIETEMHRPAPPEDPAMATVSPEDEGGNDTAPPSAPAGASEGPPNGAAPAGEDKSSD